MTAVQREMQRLRGADPEAIATHFFEQYGIVAQRHHEGRLWLFDYDQLAAHKHRMTEMVMESRGLILCAQTFDIVRRPFARFFNIGEAPAYEANIDYARLEALEKADGSLVTLYFNKVTGHWQFGTRGTAFAEGWHRESGGRFVKRILAAAGINVEPGSAEFDAMLGALDLQSTYIFECIGPDNPHVTPYAKSELVLLGARRDTGEECPPEHLEPLLEVLQALNWNVRLPRRFIIPLPLAGMSRQAQVAAIKKWVATALEFKGCHEGLVCYDPVTGKRLKVKTPLYCAVHLQSKSQDALTISAARMAEIIVNGDAAEFALYFPALGAVVQAMTACVQKFVDDLAPIWAEVKDIADQKEFALAVGAKASAVASAIYFQARKTGQAPALVWRDMPLERRAALAAKLPGMNYREGASYSLEDPVDVRAAAQPSDISAHLKELVRSNPNIVMLGTVRDHTPAGTAA